MKKCPFCGAQVDDNSLFCTECGKQIPQENVCPHCGASVSGGDAFCQNCGRNIADGSSAPNINFQAQAPYATRSNSRNNSILPVIIGGVVLVMLILAGGAVWYFLNNQKNKYSLEGLAKVVSNFDIDDDRIGDNRGGWAFFNEGLALVCKGEKYGYIDKMGNEVIPCIYDWTVNGHRNFHEGLALVGKNEDKKVFFINTEGKEAFPARYDMANDFHEGLALVGDFDKGYIGKKRYIDKKGNVVIAFTDKYYLGADFSEGLAAVWEDEEHYGKHGYIDKKGNVVIPVQYERGTDSDGINFHEGLAVVYKDGYEGYIDKKGNEVIPCKYEYASCFQEGRACVKKDGKYGYIDKKGNIIIPCIYEWANQFSEGYAFVSKDKDRENWSCIDKNGKEVFSSNYDCISSYFHEGFARVNKKSKDDSYDWKYGFIDTKGNEVIPCVYDFCEDFSEGLAVVGKHVKGRYRSFWGMKYGFVDKKGNSTFDIHSTDTNVGNNETYSEKDIQEMKEFLEKFYSGDGFDYFSGEIKESYLKKNLTTKAMESLGGRERNCLIEDTEAGGRLVDGPTIQHIKENTFKACFTYTISPAWFDYQIELTVIKEKGVYKIDGIGKSKTTSK